MRITKNIIDLISPIKTEIEYEQTLQTVLDLMESKKDSPEEYLLELLTSKIEAYEKLNYELEKLEPLDAIIVKMEELNLDRTDLYPIFGDKGKVSKFFNNKLSLSLTMIKNINKNLNIPYNVLIPH